jgi:hypothetical protein
MLVAAVALAASLLTSATPPPKWSWWAAFERNVQLNMEPLNGRFYYPKFGELTPKQVKCFRAKVGLAFVKGADKLVELSGAGGRIPLDLDKDLVRDLRTHFQQEQDDHCGGDDGSRVVAALDFLHKHHYYVATVTGGDIPAEMATEMMLGHRGRVHLKPVSLNDAPTLVALAVAVGMTAILGPEIELIPALVP